MLPLCRYLGSKDFRFNALKLSQKSWKTHSIASFGRYTSKSNQRKFLSEYEFWWNTGTYFLSCQQLCPQSLRNQTLCKCTVPILAITRWFTIQPTPDSEIEPYSENLIERGRDAYFTYAHSQRDQHQYCLWLVERISSLLANIEGIWSK